MRYVILISILFIMTSNSITAQSIDVYSGENKELSGISNSGMPRKKNRVYIPFEEPIVVKHKIQTIDDKEVYVSTDNLLGGSPVTFVKKYFKENNDESLENLISPVEEHPSEDSKIIAQDSNIVPASGTNADDPLNNPEFSVQDSPSSKKKSSSAVFSSSTNADAPLENPNASVQLPSSKKKSSSAVLSSSTNADDPLENPKASVQLPSSKKKNNPIVLASDVKKCTPSKTAKKTA
ncbi:hypothetical protein, partial [Candidatus Liberibacter sp.]|uniref:hypothetical protein n=1 Tax=Candidatus Liberibacter sp. TaxID=34022 RepID=UPI0015F44A50